MLMTFQIFRLPKIEEIRFIAKKSKTTRIVSLNQNQMEQFLTQKFISKAKAEFDLTQTEKIEAWYVN